MGAIGVAVAATAALAAWHTNGSIAAVDWLPVALILGGVLVAVLASGTALRPAPAAVAAVAAACGLAAWAGASSQWSPLPTLARDEALLTLTYAFALSLPLILLRSDRERLHAAGLVAAGAGALALAVAVELATGPDAGAHFEIRRLEFPVTYTNAQAAVLLIGLWPALAVAADRAGRLLTRALATGAAGAVLAGWVATQSKGGAIGVAVSAAVVFALSPARLRLAIPALIAGVAVAAAARVLTEPYRVDEAALDSAAAATGAAILIVFAAAGLAGGVYALLDRRVELRPDHRRAAAVVAAALALVAAVVVAAVLVSTFGRPDRALERGWDSFRSYESPSGTTHLATLGGSNRYDFWRVALGGARDHPIAGIGARGFQAEYLQRGRSGETPARAHSLPLDVLLELGVIGVALLLALLAPALLLATRAVRRDALYGVAALGGATAWLAHAAMDWTWTFPAAGIPFFILLGIGASVDGIELRRAAAAAALGVAALATILLLGAPWVSARLTERVLLEPDRARSDLRVARALDPLSVQPLLVEAAVARTPEDALRPLRRAAEKEPRSVGVRYRLGSALLAAGRREEARRELEAAAALAPNDRLIATALAELRP